MARETFIGTQQTQMDLAQATNHQTRRQSLEQRRQYLTSLLQDVDSAIAALDSHPELEDFIETMARANV
jgi:vacuolar-type H+-ATPase subunit E/Vma4